MARTRSNKKRERDPSWNPKMNWKKNGSRHMGNPVNFFCDVSDEVVNENGEKVPYRSVCLFDTSYLQVDGNNISPTKLNKIVAPKLKEANLPSHCENFEITKMGENNIPEEINLFTPDKNSNRVHKAKLRTSFKSVLCYDNSGIVEDEIVESISEDIHAAEKFKNVEKPKGASKNKKILVTKKSLNKAKQKYKENGCRRLTSQSAVAGFRADDYFEQSKIENSQRKHISHLGPYSFLNEASMERDNFVVATEPSNFKMGIGEDEAKYHANNNAKGINWDVTAGLVKKSAENSSSEDEYTHIGTKWHGKISTDKYSIEYGDSLQSKSKAPKVMPKYLRIQSNSIFEAVKENKENISPDKNPVSYCIRSKK